MLKLLKLLVLQVLRLVVGLPFHLTSSRYSWYSRYSRRIMLSKSNTKIASIISIWFCCKGLRMDFGLVSSAWIGDRLDICLRVLADCHQDFLNGSVYEQLHPRVSDDLKARLTNDIWQVIVMISHIVRFCNENTRPNELQTGSLGFPPVGRGDGNLAANLAANSTRIEAPYLHQFHMAPPHPPPPPGYNHPGMLSLQPQVVQNQKILRLPEPAPNIQQEENSSEDARGHEEERDGDINPGFDHDFAAEDAPVAAEDAPVAAEDAPVAAEDAPVAAENAPVTDKTFPQIELKPMPEVYVVSERHTTSYRPVDAVREMINSNHVTIGSIFRDEVIRWAKDDCAKNFKTGLIVRDIDCLLQWATIHYTFVKGQLFVVTLNRKSKSQEPGFALRTVNYGCYFCHQTFFRIKQYPDDLWKLVIIESDHVCSADKLRLNTKRLMAYRNATRTARASQGTTSMSDQVNGQNDDVNELANEQTVDPSLLVVNQGSKRGSCGDEYIMETLETIERETGSIDVAKRFLLLSGGRSLFNSVATKAAIEIFQELKKGERTPGTTMAQMNEYTGKAITQFVIAILGLNDDGNLAEVNKYLIERVTYKALYNKFRHSIGCNLRNDATFNPPKIVRDEDIYSLMVTLNSSPYVKMAVFTVDQKVVTTDNISGEKSKLEIIKKDTKEPLLQQHGLEANLDEKSDAEEDECEDGNDAELLSKSAADADGAYEGEGDDIDNNFISLKPKSALRLETKYQSYQSLTEAIKGSGGNLKDEATQYIRSYPQTSSEQIYFQMDCPFTSEYLLPLMIIDSTCVKESSLDQSSKFSNLFVATMLNPDHSSIVLGYMLCDGESVTNYKVFIRTLKVMNPQFNFAEMSVVSDNNGAIGTAVKNEFKSHIQSYIHLKGNITKLLSDTNAKSVQRLFHTLAQTISKDDFNEKLEELNSLLDRINKKGTRDTFAALRNPSSYARLKRENIFDIWTSNAAQSIIVKLKKARSMDLPALLTDALDLQFKINYEEIQKQVVMSQQPASRPLTIINFKLACSHFFTIQETPTDMDTRVVTVTFNGYSSQIMKDIHLAYSKTVKRRENYSNFRSPWLDSIAEVVATLKVASKTSFGGASGKAIEIPTDISCDTCPLYGETGLCIHSVVYLASLVLPQINFRLPSPSSIVEKRFNLLQVLEKNLGAQVVDNIFRLSHFRYNCDKNLTLSQEQRDEYSMPDKKDILRAYSEVKKQMPKSDT